MIPAAMVIYALLPAARARRIGRWSRDFLRARNAMAWPGDRLSPWVQPRAIGELAAIARRTGTSLIEASTAGIAWDGRPMGSIAASVDRAIAE